MSEGPKLSDLDSSQLAALGAAMAREMAPTIQSAIRAAAGVATGPGVANADDNFVAAMKTLRGQDRPCPKWVKLIPCKSPSGATFDAEVQGWIDDPTRGIVGDAEGFVVALRNYTEPEGCNVERKDGGLSPVPPLTPGATAGSYETNQEWQQWKYEIMKADIKRYVREHPDDPKRLDPSIVVANQEKLANAVAESADKDARIRELEEKLAAVEGPKKKAAAG